MSSDLEGDLNQDGIIDEMDRVRENLGGDIDELNVRVKSMFNWQAYVRSAPLTSAAAAVVLGYLLAPRLKSRPTVVLPQDVTGPATPGLGSSLWTMMMGAAARAGSVYVADLVTRSMGLSPTTEPESKPEPQYPSFDLGD